ncbi:MAG: YfjI family protein [Methylococcaceae bacterium]
MNEDFINNAKTPDEPTTDPLRAPDSKAAPYPVQALGEILGNAVKALHQDTKAPLALCAQSVLASASLATQAHFDVKLPWGELKPLSLFFLTVALSGERKTTIDKLILGAAKAQEREDLKAYDIDFKSYLQKMEQWKAENDQRNKKKPKSDDPAAQKATPEPEQPVKPMRFIEDPTQEGLFKLLAISQPSVGLFSDEGALVIGGHSLSKDNALKTMAMWCKLWDGSPITRVRAGDGASALYGRRMAINIQAQPEVMEKLLNDPIANGQGFLARCLVAWPESTIGTRQIKDFAQADYKPEIKRLCAMLKGLTEAEARVSEASKQELDPIELPLDGEAVAMALDAVNQLESLMKSGNDFCELTDRASKALENACRIAGILAVIDGGLATRSINSNHLASGLELMQWYLAEALRIRGAALIPPEVKHAEMLINWLKERDIKLFNSVMIMQRGSNQLRCKARLIPAIKILIDSGHVIENEPNTLIEGKKARTSWRILSYAV